MEQPFLILSDFTEVAMQQEVNIDKVLQGKVKVILIKRNNMLPLLIKIFQR